MMKDFHSGRIYVYPLYKYYLNAFPHQRNIAMSKIYSKKFAWCIKGGKMLSSFEELQDLNKLTDHFILFSVVRIFLERPSKSENFLPQPSKVLLPTSSFPHLLSPLRYENVSELRLIDFSLRCRCSFRCPSVEVLVRLCGHWRGCFGIASLEQVLKSPGKSFSNFPLGLSQAYLRNYETSKALTQFRSY